MQCFREKGLNELKYHIMDDNTRNDLIVINEYSSLIEELRIRLNIISTSVFLLNDNSNTDNPKQNKYLNKIKTEMDKIRILIATYPKEQISRHSIY